MQMMQCPCWSVFASEEEWAASLLEGLKVMAAMQVVFGSDNACLGELKEFSPLFHKVWELVEQCRPSNLANLCVEH